MLIPYHILAMYKLNWIDELALVAWVAVCLAQITGSKETNQFKCSNQEFYVSLVLSFLHQYLIVKLTIKSI